MFAEGAAIGLPDNSIILCMTGCDGTLMPTVSKPPDVTIGILSFLGSTIVRGPGQKRSASLYASSGIDVVYLTASEKSARCTIRGLSAGLPLAANIALTAFSLAASAPRP